MLHDSPKLTPTSSGTPNAKGFYATGNPGEGFSLFTFFPFFLTSQSLTATSLPEPKFGWLGCILQMVYKKHMKIRLSKSKIFLSS